MVWPHVKYGQVAKDLYKIQKAKSMTIIGFDRTGVGDAAIELFDVVALPFQEILMTNNRKIELVNALQTMFQTGQLQIKSKSPVREQLEAQQVKKSDAGNLIYQHPSGTHDDLFWGLAYAAYVAVPFVVGGNYPPIFKRGSDGLIENNNIDRDMQKLLGTDYGNMSESYLNRMKRDRMFEPRMNRF